MEHENERIVVGLDIGTTKVCAVVASIDAATGFIFWVWVKPRATD
jgi:cell division ATPase FtsA